jgi:hypothetical protein
VNSSSDYSNCKYNKDFQLLKAIVVTLVTKNIHKEENKLPEFILSYVKFPPESFGGEEYLTILILIRSRLLVAEARHSATPLPPHYPNIHPAF